MPRTRKPLDVSGVALELSSLEPPIKPTTIFASPIRRFEIEIGAGKGAFLVRAATAHPQGGFLGIEWANKPFRYTADRLRRRGLRNVRVLRTDARLFVQEYLPPACVDAFHVYFPDPWPKKRHHKRRLFQPEFLRAVARALRPEGRLHVVTDCREYFDQIVAGVAACEGLECGDFEPCDLADPGEWVSTNFEKKYAREGRAFWGLTARKSAQAPDSEGSLS